MTKQASLQETVGTAGQSRVCAQFEEMSWGVATNPYHDLGTDLWLMARDDRRFDLGLLVGAQVKTSETGSSSSKYFREPKREHGKIVGWWYRESLRDDHFDYWIKHSIPHILVLHNLASGKSYWVHVTKDAITRTRSGTKIFVPKNQQVTLADQGRLLDVAVGQRTSNGTWEGSHWPDVAALGPADRVRYALLTPRLMAKRHTPRVRNDENPIEAIAMLVQLRFMELDGTREIAQHLQEIDPPPFLSADEARVATDWNWNLYGSLHQYIHNGDPDVFLPLIEAAHQNTPERAAAVVLRAVTLIERGKVDEALDLTATEMSNAKSLDPVNFAWIEVQHARCLLEVGRYKKARRLAIHVQRIQSAAAVDPTAIAIAASAAAILFRVSGWHQSGSNLVSSNDTAAGWWRNQTIAQGLETYLTDRFALWAAESTSLPEHFSETWRRLRTATLLSGLAGDHASWRTEYSQLAQYVFQAHPAGQLSDKTSSDLLTDLRLAGDVESVKHCAQKLLMAGPEDAVRIACVPVNLLESTHSTGRSDLELIASAAEVLDPDAADKYIGQAVTILKHQQRYAKRVRPTFLIHNYVLQTLEAVIRDSPSTTAGRRVFLDYALTLPTISDQSFAHSISQVLKVIPEADWTTNDLDILRQRRADNWELSDALIGITATSNVDARDELHEALRKGRTRYLPNVRDIREVPQDIAEIQIAALSESVRQETEEARIGTFYRRDSRSLAMLNIWFPEVANWAPIYELMNELRVTPRSLISLTTLLRDASAKITEDVRNELIPRLEHLRDRAPIDFGEWLKANRQLRTIVHEALDALAPGAVNDQELWRLLGGDNQDRSAAARIIGRRRDASRLDILACLAHDETSVVRASSAYWIARWLEIAEVEGRCNSLLEDLSSAPGTLIANAILSGIRTEACRAVAGDWLKSLPPTGDPTSETL